MYYILDEMRACVGLCIHIQILFMHVSFYFCHYFLFQGLECCHKLEELTLDDNYLQHSLSLHRFPHLRWLSLENNRLTSLPLSSSPLPHLTYINISRNYIRDISGIEVRETDRQKEKEREKEKQRERESKYMYTVAKIYFFSRHLLHYKNFMLVIITQKI